MTDITQILNSVESGDDQAAAQLLPMVYDELRRLACAKLAHEKPGQTLDATALVHEAYLRLATSGGSNPPSFANRRHFFAVAAEAMRRILIENARRKKSEKRGGGRVRVEFREGEIPGGADADELLLLDAALTRLNDEDPNAAEIAKLRLFGGMAIDDAAEVLNISRATAFRNWTYARAWLNDDLSGECEPT